MPGRASQKSSCCAARWLAGEDGEQAGSWPVRTYMSAVRQMVMSATNRALSSPIGSVWCLPPFARGNVTR